MPGQIQKGPAVIYTKDANQICHVTFASFFLSGSARRRHCLHLSRKAKAIRTYRTWRQGRSDGGRSWLMIDEKNGMDDRRKCKAQRALQPTQIATASFGSGITICDS